MRLRMQNMNYIQFQIPEGVLENFDTHLQTFYHGVYRKELELSKGGKKKMSKKRKQVHIQKMRSALFEIVHAYKKETVDRNASSILFNTLEKRCAYLVKHCPCFSSAVARHFLQLLRSSPSISLQSAVYRRRVRLCCLGGGPGTEAVAIAKVVNDLNNAICPCTRQKLLLEVQVIDLSKDWEKTARLVLEAANFAPRVCDSDRLAISFELLEADLTDSWSEQVRKVIGEADIITMVYFVSAVNGSKGQKECASMLKNIVDHAKPESLLFFMDSSKDLHFRTVHSVVCLQGNPKQIYGPVMQEFHTLSMNSIKQFIKLYFSQFNNILCLTNCFITTAVWSKERTVAVEKLVHHSCQTCLMISDLRRNWMKLVSRKSNQQVRFKERVEKLWLITLRLDFVTDDLEEHEDFVELLDYCWTSKLETMYATKPKPRRILPVDESLTVKLHL